MTLDPESNRQLLELINNNPNKELKKNDRIYFYKLHKQYNNPNATIQQCEYFVRNMFRRNRPSFFLLIGQVNHRNLDQMGSVDPMIFLFLITSTIVLIILKIILSIKARYEAPNRELMLVNPHIR